MPAYIDQLLGQIMQSPGAPQLGVPDFSDPSQWPAWMQQAMNSLNAGSLQQRNQVLSLLQGGGTAAKADAAQQFNQDVAGIDASALDRGLYGSSVPLAMRSGATRELNRQNQRIDEGTAQQAAGVLERQDLQGPDLGMFSQLFQSAARSAAGNNGGYDGGGGGRGLGNLFSSSGSGNRTIPVGTIGVRRFGLNGGGGLRVNGSPYRPGTF